MSDPVPVNWPSRSAGAIWTRWGTSTTLSISPTSSWPGWPTSGRVLGADAPIDPRTLLPADFQFILAEVTCHYRSPATLGDQLAATIWVSQVGRKSFVFKYRINDEVTGGWWPRVQHAGLVRLAAGESRPVPAEIVARMESLQSGRSAGVSRRYRK